MPKELPQVELTDGAEKQKVRASTTSELLLVAIVKLLTQAVALLADIKTNTKPI